MFSPEELKQAFLALEHGAARLDGMQRAIDAADAAGDAEWGLCFRFDFIEESVFYDDNYKAILMIPAALAMYDANPQLHEMFRYRVMVAYKRLIEDAPDYYQVTAAQLESYFESYRKRCLEYGNTLRSYHMKRMQYYIYADRSKAQESFRLYRDEERDNLGDCRACETTAEMYFELIFGTEERALEIAAPVLSGDLRCGEIPEVTYVYLMCYYMKRRNYQKATYYARLTHPMIQGKTGFLRELGELINFYAATDLVRGVQLFRTTLPQYTAAHNPLQQLYFCNGAARLLSAVHSPAQLHLRLPKTMAPYREDGVYETAALAKWFGDEAARLAELFDKRNGSSYYTEMIQETLPSVQEDVESLMIPESPTVERRTGFLCAVPRDAALLGEDKLVDLIQRIEGISGLTIEMVDYDDLRECPYLTVHFGETSYSFHLMVQPRSDIESLRQLHYIPEEDVKALSEAQIALTIAMEYDVDCQTAFHLQLMLLTAMLPDSLALLDYSHMTILSAQWAMLAAHAPVTPSADYLFSVQVHRSETDDSFWLFTLGLNLLGLRDLEIIGVSEAQLDACYRLLCAAARRAAENDSLPDAGEPMHVGRWENGDPAVLCWLSPETALQQYPADVFGGAAERENFGIQSGILMLYPTRADYENKKPKRIGDLIEGQLTGFDYADSNHALYLTSQLAKCRYEWLCKAFARSDKAIVRVEVELSEEKREEFGCHLDLLWLTPETIDENGITGKLLESSEMLEDCREGETITVLPSRVSDFQLRVGQDVLDPDTMYLLPYILQAMDESGDK